jgi:hypothetical protein
MSMVLCYTAFTATQEEHEMTATEAYNQVQALLQAAREHAAKKGYSESFVVGYLTGMLASAVRENEDVARSVEWHTNDLKSK